MIIGFRIKSLGTFTPKEFADLLRSRVILEDPTMAENIVEVIRQGFELNVFCEHLNDHAVLEQHDVEFDVLDIEDSDTNCIMANATDFKLQLLYKDAVRCIELQPTEFVNITKEDLDDNFQYVVKRGLVRLYRGKQLIERIFSDEFDYEFY